MAHRDGVWGLAQSALAKPLLCGDLLLDALGSFLGTVAGDLLSEFHDDAVVNNAVDSCGGGHRVFEDLFPFAKRPD
jgi:hypothetical protein